ncbi:hypothetical protein PLEOSDRAFT_1100655 [Pleurotus ostreatus PC15]|uniref:F-box domain-containing protein n=1 Tax=Pleurotus ostreatus (strain PC15) TaxID=1137138 RepID=A0A067NW30_PLEO1|nr:hypothetical protein PLEOSDRAFT_1100655 [Pleurotus ostreatus PC15]
MTLPLELIINIVTFLDDLPAPKEEWEDHSWPDTNCWRRISPSLFACSLVCSTWSHICRPLIFHSIRIACTRDTMPDAFLFLHSTAPHLCPLILNLRLSFRAGAGEAVPEWMGACLSRFTNLRALELWRMPPKDTTPLTQAIVSLLASTSLSRLTLMGWDHGNNISDLRRILSACSVSLAHLTIAGYNHLPLHAASAASDRPAVSLKALRKLELFDLSRSATPFGRSIFLDCPNLETFTVLQELSDGGPWGLPSWIPARITTLNLHATTAATLPQFTRPIYPSRLTVQREAYVVGDTYVLQCINRLPFIDHLERLTIKMIYREHGLLSMSRSMHYNELSGVLQSLRHPALSIRLILNFTAAASDEKNFGADELDRITRGEIAKLKEAFAPLLRTGALSILVAIGSRAPIDLCG